LLVVESSVNSFMLYMGSSIKFNMAQLNLLKTCFLARKPYFSKYLCFFPKLSSSPWLSSSVILFINHHCSCHWKELKKRKRKRTKDE
jgi:hypothetical protein